MNRFPRCPVRVLSLAAIAAALAGCAHAPHCPAGEVEVARSVTSGHSSNGWTARNHREVTLQCVPATTTTTTMEEAK